MKPDILLLLYRLLLNLYPHEFHATFAQEMEDIFCQAIKEASEQGPHILRDVCLREFWDLPGSILHMHRRELSRQTLPSANQKSGWAVTLNHKELAVTLMAFVLPIVFILFNNPSNLAHLFSSVLILVLILVTFTIGMLKGLPRWSLPYLGHLLAITGYLVVANWLVNLLEPALRHSLSFAVPYSQLQPVMQFFWAGFTWLGLLTLTLIILGFLALLHRFWPLGQRIQQDWTLVSFTLYAESILALILLFKQYQGELPYRLASLLLLTGGAWIYLRSRLAWQRITALLAGLSLAFLILILGKWTPVPGLPLRYELNLELTGSTRWREIWSIGVQWAWMILALLAPAMLNRFGRGFRSVQKLSLEK